VKLPDYRSEFKFGMTSIYIAREITVVTNRTITTHVRTTVLYIVFVFNPSFI